MPCITFTLVIALKVLFELFLGLTLASVNGGELVDVFYRRLLKATDSKRLEGGLVTFHLVEK